MKTPLVKGCTPSQAVFVLNMIKFIRNDKRRLKTILDDKRKQQQAKIMKNRNPGIFLKNFPRKKIFLKKQTKKQRHVKIVPLLYPEPCTYT